MRVSKLRLEMATVILVYRNHLDFRSRNFETHPLNLNYLVLIRLCQDFATIDMKGSTVVDCTIWDHPHPTSS